MRGTGTDTCLITALLATLFAAAVPAFASEIPVPTPRPEPPAVATAPAAPPQAPAAAEAPAPHRRACPAVLNGRVEAEPAPALEDGACGVDSPLALESAAGVALTGRPTVTCEMAGQLARLAEEAASLARRLLDGELAAIVTGPGYECRRRNRAAAGRLSEHAFANALDIAAFRLADGREIGIERHWPHLVEMGEADERAAPDGPENSREPAGTEDAGEPAADHNAPPRSAVERAESPEAKFLRQVRDAACPLFTTVLSPDSNAAHHGHLHLDLGCHGRDCTYRICE